MVGQSKAEQNDVYSQALLVLGGHVSGRAGLRNSFTRDGKLMALLAHALLFQDLIFLNFFKLRIEVGALLGLDLLLPVRLHDINLLGFQTIRSQLDALLAKVTFTLFKRFLELGVLSLLLVSGQLQVVPC